jgi:outer membrane lipoprotein-sorting protein
MQTHWLAALLSLASPFTLSLAVFQREPVQPTSPSTAEQILQRMGRTYAGCRTYRDTGVVTIRFFDGENGRKRTERRPFTTAFVRPDRFRYEFLSRRGEEEFDRYLVCADGSSVRTWWDIRPGVEQKASLPEALAGPTGVSGGSARNVPALLLPEGMGGNLTRLRDPERAEDADIDGTICYRITGDWSRGPTTLWIEKKSFLLRRIEVQGQIPNGRTESTTDYAPEIDLPIPPDLLKFDPPQEEGR